MTKEYKATKTLTSNYRLDIEVAAIFEEMAKQAPPKIPARGDWRGLRETGNAMQKYWASIAPRYPEVWITEFSTPTKDGRTIELRWYTKANDAPGSAIVYAHGGGMILGDLDAYDHVVSEYVSLSGVPFLSVGYRLAPESKGEMLTEDVFGGLTWLIAHAKDLGVDTNRIAVMGDSGGGAPVAGTAIIARGRQIPLAKQILIYPMLDDRTLIPDQSLVPFQTWSYDSNFTAWSAVLDDNIGGESVSPLIAPARLKDFAGLTPAYIEVGELDIFRDENVAYAQNLIKSGVPVELHVHAGAPHGFDRIAPKSKLTMRAMNDRVRVIQSV